jgi:hypothetical protein
METISSLSEASNYAFGLMPYFIISLSFVFLVAVIYIKVALKKIAKRVRKNKR